MTSKDRVEHASGHVGDMEAADHAAALHQCHHDLLWSGSFEGATGGFAPDVGLIGFNDPASAAERGSEQVADFPHSFADTVPKEPSGFHAASKHALDLVGADPFLAGAHEMDDLQPQMQRQMRGLKNGPHSDSEGLAALVALVEADAGAFALELPHALLFPAVVAAGAIRPQPRLDIGEGGFFVLEMRGGKNICGHGTISYGRDTTSCGWVCQV
jgi:hypothetical protein